MALTRILITGGAGFIGSQLAWQLARDGHSVVILDNLLPQVHGDKPKLDLPDCETIWADIRNQKELTRAMKGVEVVHHLAAETGVGQSQYEVGRYVSVNTYGTALVLEAAAVSGVRQVVIASSRAVYGEGEFNCSSCGHVFAADKRKISALDRGQWEVCCVECGEAALSAPMSEEMTPKPVSIYGLTKYQQEQLGLQIGSLNDLRVTLVRLFNVYGPGQSLHNPYVGVLGTFFRRAISGRSIEIYEDGKMLRDFVFISDVVEAFRRVTGNEDASGRLLNVGTGRGVSLLEIGAEMFEALCLEPNIHISGRYRSGDVRHAVASVSRLQKVLGFIPSTAFAEGLRRFVDWARTNEANAADDLAEGQLAARALLRQGSL